MAKIKLTELEDMLKKIEDGVAIEEFKDKLIQAAKGFKELTLAKQKDDVKNTTAFEGLKREIEFELAKQKEEFELKMAKLVRNHEEAVKELEKAHKESLEQAKEQVAKEIAGLGTPSVEVFEALGEAESLVKTLVAKTPWLSGLASEFLAKLKRIKK